MKLTRDENRVLVAALQVYMGEMYTTSDPAVNKRWKRDEKIAERLLKRLDEEPVESQPAVRRAIRGGRGG